jgi:uncharacterized protein
MTYQGRAWWNELITRDFSGAEAFYNTVMGWSFEETGVAAASNNIPVRRQEPAGGIFHLHGPQFEGVPQSWMVYFAVEDVEATCSAVKANGGSVHRTAIDIPAVGRIAIAADPAGGIFGIMTPATAAVQMVTQPSG